MPDDFDPAAPRPDASRDQVKASLACFVLAGGGSKRMGRDKALIECEGTSFLARVCRRLSRLDAPIVVLGRDEEGLRACGVEVSSRLRAAPDRSADAGPVVAIADAARALDDSLQWIFVCAVDQPDVDAAYVETLIAAAEGTRGIVPLVDDRAQPIGALYAREVLASPTFAEASRMRDLVDIDGVELRDAHALGLDLDALRDVDTPADLAERQQRQRLSLAEATPAPSPAALYASLAVLILGPFSTWGRADKSCFPVLALVGIVTYASGALLARLLPLALRRRAALAWVARACWLHAPLVITTAWATFAPELDVVPVWIIASGLGAAAWLTAWLDQGCGLRRFELGEVSFVGLAIFVFPLNFMMSIWAVSMAKGHV